MKKRKLKKAMLIIFIILAAIVLIAEIFINVYKPFGRAPSKDRFAEYEKRTDYISDGKFQNYQHFELMTGGGSSGRKDTQLKPDGEIPVVKHDSLEQAAEDELKIIWFGHSMVVIQMHGMNIMIDPVLSECTSPVSFVGPKRFSDIPMTAENLPEIDLVLISHDHYDHLDYQTIMALDSKIKAYCVPLGVECHLERFGISPDKITNAAWWEEFDFGGLTVISTPAQHYSGRLPWKAQTSWWCGFALKDEHHTVYYTGDSGYGEHFKEIRERIGKIDLSLIECGQYDPRWAYTHSKPDDAIITASDLETDWFIPVHWAAFVLANHDWYEPAARLTELAAERNINIATPRIGEIVDFDNIFGYSEKWWEIE